MSEPAWNIATLFPAQGTWTEEEYLDFSNAHPRVEFDRGEIDVLPLPTRTHQNLLAYLLMLLRDHARKTGGRTRFAGTRLKLPESKYREPDLLFATHKHVHFEREDLWTGADLVVEIVSGGAEDQARDYVKKRRDYARGAVPEYWIVDPAQESVSVLVLSDAAYVEHGRFVPGERAESPTVEGFAVDVSELFREARAG